MLRKVCAPRIFSSRLGLTSLNNGFASTRHASQHVLAGFVSQITEGSTWAAPYRKQNLARPSAPGRVEEENAVQRSAARASNFSVLPLDDIDVLIKRAAAVYNTSMLWDPLHYEPLGYEFANLLYLR